MIGSLIAEICYFLFELWFHPIFQRIFILLLRLSAVQVKWQYKSKQISALNPLTDQNDVIKILKPDWSKKKFSLAFDDIILVRAGKFLNPESQLFGKSLISLHYPRTP